MGKKRGWIYLEGASHHTGSKQGEGEGIRWKQYMVTLLRLNCKRVHAGCDIEEYHLVSFI